MKFRILATKFEAIGAKIEALAAKLTKSPKGFAPSLEAIVSLNPN